jgi:hypothetical protein
VFYIGRERQRRFGASTEAIEHRHNFGGRWSSHGPRCSLEVQGSIQTGHIEGHSISAQGLASDWNCSPTAAARWRLGARIDYASGDRGPLDDSVDTFDPLYPNLSYFTDAPALYPGNNFDVHPYLSFLPRSSLNMSVGADFQYRAHSRDATYQPPGFALVGPQPDSSGDHITTLAYWRTNWKPHSNLEVTFAYVYGFAGEVIQRAGGHDLRYAMLQVSLRR